VKTRNGLARAIGFAQTIMGGTAIVFAIILFYNAFGIQTMLGFHAAETVIYIWLLIVFGILSLISGLFLFFEPQR
jgi:acid phosphatase family membrane protein YuiD